MRSTWLYFAYGSNLHYEGMASRCPDSRPIGRAMLDGWTLTFRGVADIKPREGSRTHGALWSISDRDLDRLDRYEGYPSLYRRELVVVKAERDQLVAITYVMNDDYIGLPSPSYYRTIKRGYKQWELPILDLEMTLAEVKDRLYDRGLTRFRSDGPKRLRPVRAEDEE